tara:strand:- start:652 stop:1332 length:681 start_codon:yes stop_codon:yes gene_type:complete
MHETVQRLIRIESQIKEESAKLHISEIPKIIAISKTFSLETIMPLIDYGHLHYGENKMQEAKVKWTSIKREIPKLNLHFVGKLQTNKAKDVIKLFDYVHSLENVRQAEILSKYEKNLNKKLKYFIQINLGNENQKSGIDSKDTKNFLSTCKLKYNLDVVGLMCLPPYEEQTDKYFKQMLDLKMFLNSQNKYQLKDLSMGMSKDYIKSINYQSTYIRIGTKIFGDRN